MRKKILFLICSVGMCLFLTSCWDRTELNQLAITSATGLDWENGEWVVSYQVVIPSAISAAMSAVGGGASKLPIIVYSTKGKTIRDAVWRSTFESPRKLFFAHTRVLVVSEQAARRGLAPLIDGYLRNPDSRETVSVLISEGSARRILEQLMQIQIVPGDGMKETIRGEAKYFSALPNVNINKLAMGLASSTRSAVIPEILISGSPDITTEEELNHTSLTSKLRLGRLAVLREDKLIGWLSKNEAMGVSYIRNHVDTTVFTFACKLSESEKNSEIRLTQSTTKLSPVRVNGHYVMRIKVKAEGSLIETACSDNLNKPEIIAHMEKQLESEITETITASWLAVKQLKTDVLGFGDIIHRKYPKEWKKLSKDWEAAFLQIEIKPQVNVTLKRVGLSSQSFKAFTEKGQ